MSSQEEFPDYYAILGVPPTASPEEIKQAFRALARRVHPDVMPGAGTSLLFRLVYEAYEVLSDPERRAEYDRQRQARWSDSGSALQVQLLLSRPRLPALSTLQILYALLIVKMPWETQPSRQPVDLALVIDRSNSMRGPRIEQAKAAALELAAHLQPGDRIAVVAFHNRAEVIWPLSPVEERHRLRSRLSALEVGGGTEIYRGLFLGFQELFRARRAGASTHLILLTDGRTYGDEDRCRELAEQARQVSIGISAFGIGEDWNDELLDEIAARSGGISGYITSPEEIRQRFLEHLRLLEELGAEDLRLIVEPAEGVQLAGLYQVRPELRVPPREGAGWYLGPLHLSQPIQVLLEFTLPPLEPSWREIAYLDVRGQIPGNPPRPIQTQWTMQVPVLPEEPLTVEPPGPLWEALARVVIHRMQEQAWAAVRAGKWEEGACRLQQVGTRLLELGAADLAREALEAATRLLQGQAVPRGQQLALKYRTRMLMLPPPDLGGTP
ncbi:MAG: VWA domain-containing protein [Thermoflexus sp.]|jgi:Ca-activated chloride channel family protein|nr:VWA domain-containing protein [Thermoflexus sp.]